MKKSTLIMILSLVLAVAIGVGSTMAYLQDTDEDVNVMTLGSVYITQNEQERDADGNLVPFTPNKPAYPAVGPIDWADEGVVVNGTEYKVFTDELQNVVDKIVTVTNTGKSDAYIRTIIALEAPDYDAKNLIHVNVNGDKEDVTYTPWAPVDIEGEKYVYSVFTYQEALAPQETSAPSLVQLFLDSKATNADVEKFGDTWEVLVLSQAVQTQGFADANTALNTAFGEVNATKAAEWFGGDFGDNIGSPGNDWINNNPPAPAVEVSNAQELKDALSADEEIIHVKLTADTVYDVAAWETNAIGGESTERVIIDGNGYTLDFNQTNSDWNNIVTDNNATLTLKNMNVTNSGHNDGPWNRHDLNFACDVELIDVASDKAMAFKAGASLKNVTINDANTSDTYAIWIQPKGQTVTLDNVTIDMIACSDGRGLKIDNQYVAAADEAKVTLNVSNTTFKTEEKSAILVKSTVGADITLSNVDISGVAADSTNHVWVDSDASAYADLVTVTGGNKIVEQ